MHLHMCELCARAGAATPMVMLHAERLRYLTQLLGHAPDALWALIKQDPTACKPLRAGVLWLAARVLCPPGLGDQEANWGNWEAFICTSLKPFKALIRRAVVLDTIKQSCLAALCRIHRQLSAMQGSDLRQGEAVDLAELTEACPICRTAYSTRLEWASRAARVHGYRSRATLTAINKTCLACGKVYASTGRLRRHLVAVPEGLEQWGSVPEGVGPQLHPQCPPFVRPGKLCDVPSMSPEPVCPALLTALRKFESEDCTSDFDLYDVVISHLTPLPILRNTVEQWLCTLDKDTRLYDVAESVALILTPACVADKAQVPKQAAPPLASEVPNWKPVNCIPMVLSGQASQVSATQPPSVHFAYPFDQGATCSQASKVSD